MENKYGIPCPICIVLEYIRDEILRRRIESYRRRQSDCMPRFDQSFTGLCEQNLQDTQLLKQRFLDAKVKRPPKAKEKAAKQQEAANAAASGSIQSSVHVQQKFLKRPAEDHDPGGGDQQSGENFEPPVKLQCTAQQHNSHQNDQGLTKFSVEIVQQLEFTTSAANSQPQQISTNVTVKTHANASVKSDVSSPKSNPSTPASGVAGMHQKSNIGLETLVECVKQEPDNDFADLDQCAAALEKDAAANGGAGFGGFSDLIGDDTNDEIISSATFNDLISDISNYPDYELMKDFDFEDKSESNSNTMKMEDNKDMLQNVDNTNKTTHSPLLQNQNNYSPPVFENQTIKNRLPGYSNMDFTKTELSPAAQTLKHMAEQHQHQKQMGLSFNPSTRTPSSRSPYPDFQFQGDYGSPNSNSSFHKNSPNFPQPDMIKQELIFQGNEFDIKRKTSSAAAAAAANMYKPQQQQYSPYGSPGGGHGSPGYLPRGAAPPSQGQFGGGTPPRPPSGPGQGNSNGNGPSVQINQAQQLNVSQQGHGHSIQVSAGQHVHLSGDLKGNVSIAAQQGMHFQHNSNSNQSQGTNSGNHHAHNQQPSPMSAPQHQGSPMGGGMGGQMGGPMMPNAQQMGQQQQGMQSGLSGTNGGLGSNVNMGGPLGSMAGPNNGLGSNGMGSNAGMGPNGGMGGPGGMPSGMGNMHPGMQHVGGIGHQNDSYSLSQTQTINFTQQSLRRAGGPGVPNMGGAGPGSNLPSMPGQQQPGGMGGPRLLSAQSLEQQQQQQKLLHQQQQMLRAQQQYMAAARPPPPDYKASAAGMIQSGMQPRYAGAPGGPPPVMRRVGGGHQPMPPSGPMIRSNMYMLQQQQQHQQQQMPQRASLYSRQQGPMGVGIESVQQHSQAEWRHLLMTQQQNGGFNTMRPNFQQGFNLNSGSMHQMTALQHQQIRMGVHQQQQGMGGQPQQQGMSTQNQLMVQGGGGGPMAQMNNMNQAVLHMQQQQQQQQQQQSLVQQQQQNSHMTMSSIHMQQSQSISVTNQSIQQQNNLAEQLGNASSNNQNNALSNFNPQADFNFEFLDNLGAGDSTAFTDQELLNSFDSDAGFNLDF